MREFPEERYNIITGSRTPVAVRGIFRRWDRGGAMTEEDEAGGGRGSLRGGNNRNLGLLQ